MAKLYALSDLHLSHRANLDAFVEFFSSLPSSSKATPNGSVDHHEDEYDDCSDTMVLDVPDEPDGTAPARPSYNFTGDGLILAGDLGEKLEHLRICFELTVRKFKTVWWVPGNHELYTMPGKPRFMSLKDRYGGEDRKMTASEEEDALRDARMNTVLKGEAKYHECCRIAAEYGVLTPEDEFICWDYDSGEQRNGAGTEPHTESVLVCPIFTLYDYSFRPSHVTRDKALEWALEEGVQATDEALLHPHPYDSRQEWCWSRVRKTEHKLMTAQARGTPLVIINHWPLREDLVSIPLIPRFSLWCGTKLTEDWHTRFNAKVVVSGHLHVRRTDWRDDCRFEEVSLGYPRQWDRARMIGKGVGEMMREILPARQHDDTIDKRKTIWRREG